MPAGPRISCTKCEIEKDCSDFHRKGAEYRSVCKPCRSAEAREYRKTHHSPDKQAIVSEKQRQRRLDEPRKAWAISLNHMYRITPEQWEEMYEHQGGLCAICQRDTPGKGKRFAVDHDHACCSGVRSCGKCVRGLLCHYCNLMLGVAQDSQLILWNAINYLMDWEKNNASG